MATNWYFTFAVPGQPTWKREEYKVNYPQFRKMVGNLIFDVIFLWR